MSISPIDGQISRYYLTLGNLVNQDQTLLTTVVSVDPMYVYFDMDEPTLLAHPQGDQRGQDQAARERTELPVLMGLARRGRLPAPGDDQLRQQPGQSRPPAASWCGGLSQPQPQGGHRLLSPGMFVRIRLPIGQPHPALLVIDRAVASDQGLKFVYVLDAENKVQYRRVTTGPLQDDGLRVIEEGLKPDDWVVVGGLQQVRPRMTIKPEQVPMPTLGRPTSGRGRDTAPGGQQTQPSATAGEIRRRSRAVDRRNQPKSTERSVGHDLAFLHRSADLRDGPLCRHHADRRDRALLLPMAQYPRITPPGVSVSISYPGASAPVVADTVAAPIEQQVNGIEGMLYMSSQMGNDGTYTLTVTFDIGTDVNTALVMVQNRVALAMPQLPTRSRTRGSRSARRRPIS